MKKLMSKLAILMLVVGMMSSCYTSKVYHGNTSENTPMTEVLSKKNQIILWGLVPLESSKQKAQDVVGDKQNYQVQTQHTFIDGLLSTITFGIYTPTTTTYFVPAGN